MNTVVVNRRNCGPYGGSTDVLIGRGDGPWGNPYVIGKDGDRENVVRLYRELMEARLQGPEAEVWRNALRALRGKRLVCWCKPAACHGDVLAALAEGIE